MRPKRDLSFGLWELAVLALLREHPMHPYEMQRLLRERRKDELLALKRGSLYHAIRRLSRAGWIEAGRTERQGRRPERTTYRITSTGRHELMRRLEGMIATPKRESSEFMACLSFLVLLAPEDAKARLDERMRGLEAEIAGLREQIAGTLERITRINLLESEYLLAMREAELRWTRGLSKDLRSRKLKWNFAEMAKSIWARKSRIPR